MRAVIPVAGVGTRMRPHTYALPKVLLNVAGKPILAHILDELKEQNILKATIITGYMGKMVEEFVLKRYPDMQFDFVVQEELLGLGHAIWKARETFDDKLMIILGDTIFDVDLSKATKTGLNSLGVKEVEDPRRFGVALLDENNIVSKLIEKPDEPISKLALVGLYNIENSKLLAESLDELITKGIKTRGEYQLTDALQLMIEKGEKFDVFHVEGWFDCGKPETLLSTNKFLLDQKPQTRDFKESIIIPPVYISENAVIKRSVIGPYTSVADGAIVEESIVKNSIISYGAKVSSSLLDESIIGNDAEVEGHFTTLNVGNSSQIFQNK
jgi:glucose-1-phosphate thymidylyltransferase